MHDQFLEAAIAEARFKLVDGGISIGSVLVIDGRSFGRGRNRRAQNKSAILHAEMDCFENAGRLTAREFAKATNICAAGLLARPAPAGDSRFPPTVA